MKAYGKELPRTDVHVRVEGKGEFYLVCMTCMSCDYTFFVPDLPEHEPSYCANCGIKILGVDDEAQHS